MEVKNCDEPENGVLSVAMVNGGGREMPGSAQMKGMLTVEVDGGGRNCSVVMPTRPLIQAQNRHQSAINGLLSQGDLASRATTGENSPLESVSHLIRGNTKHLPTSDSTTVPRELLDGKPQKLNSEPDARQGGVPDDPSTVSPSTVPDKNSDSSERRGPDECLPESRSGNDSEGSESGRTLPGRRADSEMAICSEEPPSAIEDGVAESRSDEENGPKSEPPNANVEATASTPHPPDSQVDVEMLDVEVPTTAPSESDGGLDQALSSEPKGSPDDSIGKSQSWLEDRNEMMIDSIDPSQCPSDSVSSQMTLPTASASAASTSSTSSSTSSSTPITSSSTPITSSSTPITSSSTSSTSSSVAATAATSKTKGASSSNALIFIPDLSDELMQGFRILNEIFGDKCKSFVWPFLDRVDTAELWDYEIKITKPMWLRKIESKFINKEYRSITEFAADMRQMLENCYRYNGMKHKISKYAQTLENVFEQKLALLSRPLQEKTTLYVTSEGKYQDGCPNTTELSSGRLRRSCTRLAARALEQASATPLAFHLGRELERQEREEKRQKIVDRRDEIIKERQDLLEWDKQMIGDLHWTYMKSVWEIPAIGHYLCLCQSVLELEEISFFELERAFAIPMESMILRRIFTTLLSTPYQRTRLSKKPPMPYKVWEARLREWVRGWYHVLTKLEDPTKVYEKIGVPERFFEVLGPHFPLDRVQYHELTYYERVWVMKALCDQLFETQMPVRRCVLSQPIEDQRPIILGVDGEANSYIHFPQFCGADLRVYRQTKYPDLTKKTRGGKQVKEIDSESVASKDDAPLLHKKRKPLVTQRKTTKKAKLTPVDAPRARPSRLRQRLKPTHHFGTYAESLISSTESEDTRSEVTEVDGEDPDESDCPSELSRTTERPPLEYPASKIKDKQLEKPSAALTAEDNPKQTHATEGGNPDSSFLGGEEKSKLSNSTTEEDRIPEEVRNLKQAKEKLDLNEEGDIPEKIVAEAETLCNGDVLSQSSNSENSSPHLKHSTIDTKMDHDGESTMQPPIDNGKCQPSTESKAEQDCSIHCKGESESVSQTGTADAGMPNANESTPSDQNPPAPQGDGQGDADPTTPQGEPGSEAPALPELPPHEEVLPVLGEFELVCDGMDSLRDLVEKFAPPEPKPAPPSNTPGRRKRGAPSIVRQPMRKRCEKDLHEKLTNLLLELTPWEAKLARFATRNREKFKREYEVARAAPETDQDIKDIWASEESSSESESSESEEEEDDEEERKAIEDEDEEWDASMDGRRLRKRSRKQLASYNEEEHGDDDEEEAEGKTKTQGDDLASGAAKKPKRPRPRSQQQSARRSSPPHKNQLNTSLMELLRKLSDDGLRDAAKRLQTMIKRGEISRTQRSKGSMAPVSGCGDGQAVTALLNKTFWVAAKPPAVEGIITKTIEELITTYPTFVQNLIFRNMKSGLSKIAEVEKLAQSQTEEATKKANSDQVPLQDVRPSEEADTASQPDTDEKTGTSGTIETRFSVTSIPREATQRLGSATKTKEVMDDWTLQGLYSFLTLSKKLLRERLAIGLSELLPDFSNLQKTVVKEEPGPTPKERTKLTTMKDTTKELLLKMLPKPSQYLSKPTSDVPTSRINSTTSSANAVVPSTNSILVSVPTSKLAGASKSGVKSENASVPQILPPASGSSTSAGSGTGTSMPHGVYTIKVDASVWAQLQGKPALQQEFVLQQIRDLQQRGAATESSSSTSSASTNRAGAVTCIRGGSAKSPATPTKTSTPTASGTTSPTTRSPGKTTSRLPQCKNMPHVTDVSALQPVKVLKSAKPKAARRNRPGCGEATSNLSQKELIALLQQQQRQLELHRQKQQQQQLPQKIQQKQSLPEGPKTLVQQPSTQPFCLSASGALASPTKQIAPGPSPKTTILTNVAGVIRSQPQQVISRAAPAVSGSSAVQPTKLSTTTVVTASLTQPKMAANPMEADSKPATGSVLPNSAITAALPTLPSQVAAAKSTSSTSILNSPGTKLHLVQTSKGSQFLLQTGAGQQPKLVNLATNSGAVSPAGGIPVVLAQPSGQPTKPAAVRAPVVPTSSVLAQDPGQSAVRLMMHPNQMVTDTSSTSALSLQQSLLQQLGQLQQAATTSSHRLPAAKQPAANQLQVPQQPVQRQPSPIKSTTPAATQRPPVAILHGQGEAKVVVGSPAKVVQLVHPSHLSTASSFVAAAQPAPKLSNKSTTSQESIGNPKVVSVPVLPSKGVPAASPRAQIPVSVVAPSSAPLVSTTGTGIQEHLQQVILQQLASGKLKLSTQTLPAQAPATSPASVPSQPGPPPAPVQLAAGSPLLKTMPLMLSPQQLQQVMAQLPQASTGGIALNPGAAVAKPPQLLQQSSPAGVLQGVQIVAPAQTAAPTVRLQSVADQAQPLVIPSRPNVNLLNSGLQMPAVVVSPTKVVVPTSSLAAGQRLGGTLAVGQGVAGQGVVSQGVTSRGLVCGQGMVSQVVVNRGVVSQGVANQGVVNQGVVNQGVFTQGLVTPGVGTQVVVSQGLLSQGVVSQGVVTQGVVSQSVVPQCVVSQGVVTRTVVPQGVVSQGVVTQGVVSQGVVTQGVVPQGVVPQGVVPQGVVSQGMVTQGVVPQGVVSQGLVSQGVASQAAALQPTQPITLQGVKRPAATAAPGPQTATKVPRLDDPARLPPGQPVGPQSLNALTSQQGTS